MEQAAEERRWTPRQVAAIVLALMGFYGCVEAAAALPGQAYLLGEQLLSATGMSRNASLAQANTFVVRAALALCVAAIWFWPSVLRRKA